MLNFLKETNKLFLLAAGIAISVTILMALIQPTLNVVVTPSTSPDIIEPTVTESAKPDTTEPIPTVSLSPEPTETLSPPPKTLPPTDTEY